MSARQDSRDYDMGVVTYCTLCDWWTAGPHFKQTTAAQAAKRHMTQFHADLAAERKRKSRERKKDPCR